MQCDDRGYCSKAVKRIGKDYRGFSDDMERAMKLLGDRFCPMTRVEPVRPGKLLHRVTVAVSPSGVVSMTSTHGV